MKLSLPVWSVSKGASIFFLFLGLAGVRLHAESPQNSNPPLWLADVLVLQTGMKTAFSCRVSIETGAEHLRGFLSWAPPDRRCLILCDTQEELPLLIAVDGQAWMYDLIGGQILVIRAEPELKMQAGSEKFEGRYGLRADFPDDASRRTIRLDFASVILGIKRKAGGAFAVNKEQTHAEVASELRTVILDVTPEDPKLPQRFLFQQNQAGQKIVFEFTDFSYGADLPGYHRPLDNGKLQESVPVGIVAQSEGWSREAQDRKEKFLKFLQGGGVFILRTSLRDTKLREALEANSPVKLDFAEMEKNETKLRSAWQDALAAQKFELPPIGKTE